MENQSQACYGRKMLKMWLLFGTCVLQAEQSGAFIGVGLEVGRANKQVVGERNGQVFQVPSGTVVQSASYVPGHGSDECVEGNCKAVWTPGVNGVMNSTNATNYGRNQPMFGLNVLAGYKQFFGKKKWFGLRYYGFFDYGHSNFSNATAANRVSVFYLNNDKVDMYTYGAGIDALFDIINKKKFAIGLFVGVQFAGNSWTSNKTGYYNQGFVIGTVSGQCAYIPEGNVNPCNPSAHLTNPVGTTGVVNPASLISTGPLAHRINSTHFQFLVDVGLRTNFIKHHGVEFGIKIPTIPNMYYKGNTTKGGDLYTLTETFRRQYSMYLRYIYSF
ncbi:Outer membrane protein/porin [Helicobacter heilmannii]|uniref:Putative Outer membrane protein n=3 Tax=Helicobacter heilmannii TaxID=35817 RepID=A0A0K2XI18_HELHE|nr:putative Outer membrane protein [Helicobacter heilmannii ASB1.4]CRF46138.1 Outer membrane protein/porin [Helicobacter heilmannii]CRF47724.1 Outer membrane protein/porin [Helicobacter heilmannii]CRF49259.1 Outer membrane protein/porin [Helicobacter heilmannii]CRI35207.1 putative Outer membrane protein [Helicobacter heilmannii]